MQVLHCPLPLPRLESAALASNQALFGVAPPYMDGHACHANVRLMRRSKEVDGNRFALSGKLADVCAALDALAEQEMRNAWRIAAH